MARKTAKNLFQYKTTCSVNRAALRQAAQFETLSKDQYRIVLLLMTALDSKTPVDVSAKQISKELGIDKKDVKDAISKLCAYGILTKRETNTTKGYTIFDDEYFDSSAYEDAEDLW